MSEQVKYSIVIPCYKSHNTIRKVVELTMSELADCDIEFVLVNDGSPDNGATIRSLIELVNLYTNVSVVDLARNSGQHNAVLAGLNYTQGDFVIAMDDDMQTHPSQIHKLIEEIDKGYDVVYAYYPKKKHKWYRNIGSYINSWTVRKLIGKPKELKTSSFWIIRKFVRDYVIQYKNAYAYIQGLFLRTTNNIKCIPVEHFEREEGMSNYTFKALIKLWSNIIGFSVVPLRMASMMGCILSVSSLLGAVVIFVRKFFMHLSGNGWPSLMTALCFFSGIILLFLGLIGEYVGRMFLASNNQPQYVVRKYIKYEENKNEKTDDIGCRSLSDTAD